MKYKMLVQIIQNIHNLIVDTGKCTFHLRCLMASRNRTNDVFEIDEIDHTVEQFGGIIVQLSTQSLFCHRGVFIYDEPCPMVLFGCVAVTLNTIYLSWVGGCFLQDITHGRRRTPTIILCRLVNSSKHHLWSMRNTNSSRNKKSK